jgi:hypothetical protein
MNKLTKVAFKLIDLIVIFVMTFGAPMSAFAQDPAPLLTTDKSDYAPGEYAQITGAGFTAGEYILSASGPAGTEDWGTVTADDSGVFVSDSRVLDATGDYEVSAYASGSESALASVTFAVSAPPPPAEPTEEPTQEPTAEPTAVPIEEPTALPTLEPTPTEPPTPLLIPFIQSDKADYAAGELVTLTGGNWQGDTQVRIFVNDDIWQSWSRDVNVDVAADGTIIDSFNLPTWFVATYKVVATGRQTGRVVTTLFTDSPGSYSIKWYAADPDVNRAPYLPTYDKVKPGSITCPTERASDPMQNAVAYGPTFSSSNLDAVTSLMPRTMALGQIVPFEIEIAVSGSTAPENGTIQFIGSWLAKTTNGDDFGFDPTQGVICAFVDYGDVGTVDPLENAKVDNYSFVRKGSGTNNDRTEGTVQVSGLDSGDNVIVEVWVAECVNDLRQLF